MISHIFIKPLLPLLELAKKEVTKGMEFHNFLIRNV